MAKNKEKTAVLEKGVYIIHADEELKTPDLSPSTDTEKNTSKDNVKNKGTWLHTSTPTVVHFLALITQGLLVWGLLWLAWGDGWSWNGKWFKPAVVVVIAWSSGQLLQRLTTLPPLLAAILTGILARNLGYLDMRGYPHVDNFLRKIYPVIILGKSSLGWDLKFMKANWRQVFSLGVVPWTAEVLALATCSRYFLHYPWVWGILLGSIYASLSCAVVMPSVLKVGTSPDRTHNWPQLCSTAGGIDTALSVGIYGIVYSYIFSDVHDAYRYTKVALTLFVGVAMGIAWGSLAKLIPHSRNPYVTELRVLFVLLGGLFGNFLTLHLGWGGAGGVAVLACNATAANHWSRDGWKLNNNPASTVYRVLWAALEPAVFAYTGTYFEIQHTLTDTILKGFGILLVCLAVRLACAFLMCWDMSVKERIFICCSWTPKSIVEAVLCPLALNTLILRGGKNEQEMEYAEQLMRLVVQAILVTTPVGYLFTKHLGPVLLRDKRKEFRNESEA
ncbi:sodium/hydrogen exchanger 9B2 isoform X1 [Bombyx mori]|uniref:Sodium/hydrogen exchanger 9B2-like n=1 Tax=Bombyx mori TaxID=7091 RepID=A0A8R1WLN9_BOMMO|nr:sodium/hydrogen exchanger 9B2 isoform X1 [Bombyx mori]